jgi:hypothetical protein
VKRTELRRKTPLKQGTSRLRQRAPLPKVAKKKRRADAVRRFKEHREWIASLPCCSCGSLRDVVAAHLRIDTDGGTALKPSDWWTLPLCDACHHVQHQSGERTFWEGDDPWALCKHFAARSPVEAVRDWARSKTPGLLPPGVET